MAMKAPGSSKSPASTSGRSTQNGSFYVRPRTKMWTVVICFVLMIGASIGAVLQPLKPDPQERGIGAWFWHPIETNPYARLPKIDCANEYACRLNSVAVSEQGEIWAVGNVGLVLHRAAGQTHWEQLRVTAIVNSAPAPTPTPSINHSIAVPTPPHGTKPVPDLRGMSETGAAAEAEKAGFKIEFLARPATRQILQVIDQSPAPGTITRPGTLIRVKLALPKAGARLVDKLIPTVYAAEPEHPQRKDPQVARPDSEIRQPPPQQQQQQQAPKSAAQQQQHATAQQQSSQSQQPIPILTVTPMRGAAPLSVIVKASTSPPNKSILVMFNFGDGAISDFYSVPDTTYTYKAAGTYRITATFREHGTDFASTSVAVIVEPERSSTSILPLREDDLIFVTCSDKDECRALGRSGRVYTVSGASQWEFRQAGFVLPPGDGLIPSSAMLKSTFDGKIYASLPDRFYDCNQQPLRPIFSANPVFGCFLGFNSTNGSVHEPSATHGLPGNLPTKAEIHGESFLYGPSGLALVVGDDGIILSTSDGGKTWTHETQGPEGAKPNHRLPAPWYWGLAIGLIIACTVVVALPVEPAKAEDSIADWAVTDAPLKPGDTDSLDFMPMALGLSRFIRNPKTQPPVTIAIEGEWGTGKSSVMSLLRGDLEKSRYRPVWFNAWHHQSEEQLLAALLEHIKGQAIPPWWHIDNWIFRARLVYNRFHRKWPLLIVLIFLFSAATTYEFTHHAATELIDAPENLIPFKKYIPSFSESKTAVPTPASLTSPDAKSCAPGANCNQNDLGHLGLLLSLFAILGAILRAAKTFGINSAKLTDNLRNASSIKDLKPDPAIRSQFAREFGDFCKAWDWGSRRVILFIDDLDRCRPESVVTVLESINFLTTSGNCMIVLGIAQDQVTHAVGLGFKEIAEAEAAYDGTANNEQEKAAARFKYGRLYIKKLVNIVAPLPKTTIEQRRRVLEARAIEARRQEQQQKAADPVSWRLRLWDGLSESGLLVRKITPVAGLVLAVILSAWSGYQIEAPVPQPISSPSAKQPGPTLEPEQQQTQTASKPENAKPGAAQPLVYDRPTTEMASLRAGQSSASGFWRSMGLAGLFLTVLFGILGYQLSARTNQDAQNSPEFEKSLEIWGPYIVGICDTPREIKRALNDLRYQAMTRRSSGPNITRGDRLIRAMRLIVTGKREEQPAEIRVNEAALPPRMAAELAGLTENELNCFLNPQVQYTSFTDSGFPKPDTAHSENLNRLVGLKAKHIAQFGEWLGTKVETPQASAKSAGQNS